jgi:DNA-binding LacI/PurR family transcriptional regulator
MPPMQVLPGNHIMQQFLQALAAASVRRGHNVVLVVADGDPRSEMRRLIASRSVDAFLLSELQPDDPAGAASSPGRPRARPLGRLN